MKKILSNAWQAKGAWKILWVLFGLVLGMILQFFGAWLYVLYCFG